MYSGLQYSSLSFAGALLCYSGITFVPQFWEQDSTFLAQKNIFWKHLKVLFYEKLYIKKIWVSLISEQMEG